MKTNVEFISTNQTDRDGRVGKMICIRTEDGQLKSKFLQTLILSETITTIPTMLLEELHEDFVRLCREADPGELELAFSLIEDMVPVEEEYPELLEHGEVSIIGEPQYVVSDDEDWLWSLYNASPADWTVDEEDEEDGWIELDQRLLWTEFFLYGRKMLRRRLRLVEEFMIVKENRELRRKLAASEAGARHLIEFA